MVKRFTLVLVLINLLMVSTIVYAKGVSHENPSYADATQELIRLRTEGVAHFESGIAQKKALSVFQQAVKMQPKSGVEHYNLGVIYKKLNKITESKAALIKATILDKKLAHPHYLLGLIYLGEGSSDKALTSFSRAAELMPMESSVHYQLSRLYRESNQTQRALQAIIETLKLDSYHTGAMYQLYLHHQQLGDKEKANQVFKEFSRLKKAIGKTRKEVNPDESILARPIGGDIASLKLPFQAMVVEPRFTAEALSSLGRVEHYAIGDVDNNNYQDIAIIDQRGRASIWTNNKGTFSVHAQGPSVSDTLSLDLVKFKRGAPYSLFVTNTEGLTVLPLKDANPQPKDPKAKHHNKKNTAPKVISLTFGETEFISQSGEAFSQLADVDHDGDTDIVLGALHTYLLNRGNAEFDVKTVGDEKTDVKADVRGADLRNMIAVDYVAVVQGGKRSIFRDDMGGRYTELADTLSPLKSLYWHDLSDMDNDGRVDVVSLTRDGLVVDFNKGDFNFAQKRYRDKTSPISDGVIFDYNNDGSKDIAFALEDGSIHLWMNRGNQKFELSQGLLTGNTFTDLDTLDVDADGAIDLLARAQNGTLTLLRNTTPMASAHWIKLRLDGIRSAADGRFTQVEVRYGGFYSKYEARGDIVHIPLGEAQYAELLRISWPNGFVENKFNIKAENTWYFAESERISGSCPSVYAWNGERYVYITDAFISGPMGVPTGPGQYFPVGDDEYIKIQGEHLQKLDGGQFKLSVVEELKEVTYLDKVELLAVDYPETYEMFPNEHLLPPHFPDFKLHVTEYGVPVDHAVDHNGHDVTDYLRKMDYRYPHDFSRLDYTGFVDANGVVLGLSDAQLHAKHLRLFLTGWFYYFDSTSLVAASQQPDVEFIWPQVQVKRNGQWEFLKRIGIPSGKEKTVVVELGNEVPLDAEGLRIWTNIELYWDRILVDTSAPPSQENVTINTMAVEQSTMRLHGFSRLIRPQGEFPMPDRFNYHDTSFNSLWNPLTGKYTRYGEVEELLHTQDSLMAVFSSGDEVSMIFNGSELPVVKPGYKRDFLLYLNGFVKDGDKYTAHAGTVTPMPFKGMRSYPFSKEELVQAGIGEGQYHRYLNEYQRRDPLRFTDSDSSALVSK